MLTFIDQRVNLTSPSDFQPLLCPCSKRCRTRSCRPRLITRPCCDRCADGNAATVPGKETHRLSLPIKFNVHALSRLTNPAGPSGRNQIEISGGQHETDGSASLALTPGSTFGTAQYYLTVRPSGFVRYGTQSSPRPNATVRAVGRDLGGFCVRASQMHSFSTG